jgi:AcrR family transcriptional regulator
LSNISLRDCEEAMTRKVKMANDRRVQKTQNLLRGALVSLIAEKPYDSIVVKEILDRANVGRSTFYMHFGDKDDLLVSGIHEMLGMLPQTPRLSAGKGLDRILWFSLPVFEYHHRHAHTWGDRIGTRGRAILHEHLRRVLAEVIVDVLKKEFGKRRKSSRQIPADLLSEYVASTFVLVLNWWLDKKMLGSPSQINDVFHGLVSHTLGAMLE